MIVYLQIIKIKDVTACLKLLNYIHKYSLKENNTVFI